VLVSYKVSLPHETDSACMQFSSIINAAGLTFQFNAQFTLPARHDKTVLSVLCELDNCYQCVQTSVSVGNGLELSRIQFTPPRQTDTDGTVLSGLAWRCELGVNVTIESVLTSDQKVDDVVNGAACVADTLVLASVDVSRIAKPNCLVALIEVSAHSALFTATSEHIRFSLYSSYSPLLVFRAVD